MISIKKNFLFIHVPKTGGNSMQNILRDYSEDQIVTLAKHQDGVERFGVRNCKYEITKHSTLSHYKSVLDPKTYHSLFKFATVRNPWDMIISYYFSPHRGVSVWNREEFINLVKRTPTLRHFVCQNTYCNLDNDIDFLIRFERLDEDFESVCKKIDIPYSHLPRRNSSIRSHYSTYYDEELREIVQKKFNEEILVGNYTFENA